MGMCSLEVLQQDKKLANSDELSRFFIRGNILQEERERIKEHTQKVKNREASKEAREQASPSSSTEASGAATPGLKVMDTSVDGSVVNDKKLKCKDRTGKTKPNFVGDETY